jgi:hypothetical protein
VPTKERGAKLAFVKGIGINALTSADPGGPNGGAVFHDASVWLHGA